MSGPADVGPGVVVRLRIRGQVYCTRRMPLDDARDLARELRASATHLAAGTSFMPFPDECCDELVVRADAITAIEITPVQRLRGSHPITASSTTAATGGPVSGITVNLGPVPAGATPAELARRIGQGLRDGAR